LPWLRLRKDSGLPTVVTAWPPCAASVQGQSQRLVVADREVAWQILALNTEKAHNLKSDRWK